MNMKIIDIVITIIEAGIEEIEAKLAEIGLWWQMTDRDWATWGLSHIEWIKAH